MRTKALLWFAAITAAAITASTAQVVYSVNAVGYVNKKVPANGYALLANPLNATSNTVSALLTGQVPESTTVFLWNKTAKKFDATTWQGPDFGWDPAEPAALSVNPGDGMFVKNPGATEFTITFVGDVPQGTLNTPLIAGLQIVSSQVPQAGTISQLGYTPTQDDKVYVWNVGTQKYVVSQYQGADFGWDPAEPTLDVGDAFFLSRTAAGTWTRTFNVNQ